jgi:diguanylate cyclase (GGDEF)-like protein/PAS domain S-box-containing protein
MRAEVWRSIVEGVATPIILVAGDGNVRWANKAAGRYLGVFAIDAPLTEAVPAQEHARVRAWLDEIRTSEPGSTVYLETVATSNGGEERRFELLGRNLLDDPVVEAIVVSALDVTTRWNLARDLADQALRDPLTGLANRALLADRLAQAHVAGRLCVVFVDLDRFKVVNDRFGHAVGDDVLREIGRRMARVVRGPATVGRLAGDEFVVLLPGATVGEARTVAERILATTRRPVDTAAGPVVVDGSAGVAANDDAVSSEDILRHADAAMYQAKARGRGTVVAYEPELTSAERLRMATLRDLDELRRRNAELLEDARTDPLLGIPNLRRYEERLEEIDAEARRTGTPYSIVFCDVDRFGRFNKRWGEQAGDDVLRGVARTLVDASRAGDEVFRRGGEELVVVLPRTSGPAAAAAAERLRSAVAAMEVPAGTPTTISAGVATLDPSRHRSASDVERDADRAMIAAKRAGRDRVVVA